jgi:hypothetical protein
MDEVAVTKLVSQTMETMWHEHSIQHCENYAKLMSGLERHTAKGVFFGLFALAMVFPSIAFLSFNNAEHLIE